MSNHLTNYLQSRVFVIYTVYSTVTSSSSNRPLSGQLQCLPIPLYLFFLLGQSLLSYVAMGAIHLRPYAHTKHCGVVEVWRWMGPWHFLFSFILTMASVAQRKPKLFPNMCVDSTKQPCCGNCCLCCMLGSSFFLVDRPAQMYLATHASHHMSVFGGKKKYTTLCYYKTVCYHVKCWSCIVYLSVHLFTSDIPANILWHTLFHN